MPISVKEFSNLKKMMMLTTSDNDNEALTALRMSNAILKKNGLTWDMVFARTVKTGMEMESASDVDEQVRQNKAQRNARYADAFEYAERAATGSFKSFIGSLKEQWENRGSLSMAQEDALFKTARRAGWAG